MAEPQRTVDDYERATNHSAPPARGYFDHVQHRQHVHHSCGGDEARAVISRRARDVWSGGLEEPRKIIEDAASGIGQKADRAERISRMWRKNVAAKQVAGDHQAADRDEEQEPAAPAAQQQMSEARHEPRQ